MRRSGVEIMIAAILLHIFFITHFVESQTKRGELPSFGIIEKDPQTGAFRVKPPSIPPQAKSLKKSKFDYQRFEKELELQKRFTAQQEEMKKMHHVQDQAMLDRRTKQLSNAPKLSKIKFLGKETEFYQGSGFPRKTTLFRSTNSLISNVLINGKQVDTIYSDDPFTLSFSFAPNTISARVNIFVDINKNGIVDSDDIPVITNGIVFDDGEFDKNDAAGQYMMEFPKNNFYSVIISSLIFEVNDYQSISSATLTIKEKVSPKVIIGTIKPMFKNTIISLYSYGSLNYWYRNVFPDSAGKFTAYYDTTYNNTVFVNSFVISNTPQGYLPPNDTNITVNKDTVRFTLSYKTATEFIEGYLKDQFGSPVKNGVISINSFGLNIHTESDSSGYYKLGVKTGGVYVNFNAPSGSDEYMQNNYQSTYLMVGSLQTVRQDFVFVKAQSSISGSIKYGTVGVGGVLVGAYNDSMSNQVFTSLNGNYSIKVFKPSNMNIPYGVSTGINDYGYYIDSAYRQNILTGATNVNFEMKKILGGVQGRVTDLYSGKPIKNAGINVSGSVGRYVQTDDSGYYKIRIPEGKYSLNVNATYYDYYYEYDIAVGNTFVMKNISLLRTGSFSGTITDESGNPVSNAYINALDSLGTYWGSIISDNQGNYVVGNLQTSTYKAQGSGSGFIPQWYDKKSTKESATSFKVTKGFDTPNINFVLSRGGSISGIVKDKNGVGIPNVYVTVRDTFFYYYWNAFTDDSGKYMVTGLLSGKYYISTYGNDYLDQWYNGVSNYMNATKVSVIIYQNTPNINFTLSKGASISGKVKDKLGNPIPHSMVAAVDTSNYLSWYAYANDSGMYEIKRIIPGMKVFIVAMAEGYSRRWFDNALSFETATPFVLIGEEEKQNINFMLPVSGKISGTVKNKSGAPVQYAYVNAQKADGFNSYGTSSDQFGNYLIDNLDGGKYLVAASNYEYTQQWYNHKSSMELADTVIVEEETITPNINFDLTTGGKITGIVKNTNGGYVQYAYIYVSKLDGSVGYSVNSDDQGKYTVNNLQPGKYFASAYQYSYPQQWYNHKAFFTLADTISVVGDETIANINFDLISPPPPSTDSIVIKITLPNIPDTLVFSKTGLTDYYVDYWWGIRIDVDNNPNTGQTGANGCEIELVAFHYKVPGEQEYKSNIIDGTFHVLIEWNGGDNGTWRHSDIPISRDKNDKNTIIIKAPKDWSELYPITSSTKYFVYTYSSVGGIEGSDHTDLSSGFVGMSDPAHDVSPFFIDYIDILKVSPNIVTSVKDITQTTIPNSFSLAQNYPNPFNPTTIIRYGLPTTSQVKISIYNILGQVVNELVNEEQSAGWKEVQWNAKNVSSGMYFYKLETVGSGGDIFNETKKMTLLK
ncbi:MAG: carboxypeptidase regulatory-like domain-containing protein [Bacteroidota bacterium]|nr:carboxypeptidase regulatory-like domain-containing protein [Bacteroidota bacterium]